MKLPHSAKEGQSAFGQCLAKAIVGTFGSSKVFASKAGISEAAVSQVLRGRRVKPETARQLARVFSSPAVRLRLREAYLDSYYPNFGELDLPDGPEALHEIHILVGEGEPDLAHSLASSARNHAADALLRLDLSERIVQLDLRQGRFASAVREAKQIREFADAKDMKDWVARSFWFEANARRNAPVPDFAAIETARKSCWQLADLQDPEFTCMLRRDAALDVLKALKPGRPLSLRAEAALEHAWDESNLSVMQAENANLVCMGLQVRARVEVARGMLFKAEDTLEEALAFAGEGGADMPVKAMLTRAKIQAARGDLDAALETTAQAVQMALSSGDLHHIGSAEELMLGIETMRERSAGKTAFLSFRP